MFTIERNKELLSDLIGMLETNNPIYFKHTLIVKSTPHNEICRLQGVVKNVNDEVVVFDGTDWYDLQPEQNNVGYVLQTLKQRLTTILKQ